MKGVKIGHYSDFSAITGCTVFLFENKAVCSYFIAGRAAGTKELAPLSEDHIVEKIDALCISGGSAFGLDSSSGVMKYLEERGQGFDAGVAVVPIVPSAIIFDLAIGDSKVRPSAREGYKACENAAAEIPERGSIGAGTGATVGKIFGISRAMKGGFGFCAVKTDDGAKVEAYAVVNSFGDVIGDDGKTIIAGARCEDGKGFAGTSKIFSKGNIVTGFLKNTVISVIITDALFSKAQCGNISKRAFEGIRRAVNPAATLYDGDIIFTASAGDRKADLDSLSSTASNAVETAIRDAVLSAKGLGGVPSVKDLDIKT